MFENYIQDTFEKSTNKFQIVCITALRTKDLTSGALPVETFQNRNKTIHKPTVTALYEVTNNLISTQDIIKSQNRFHNSSQKDLDEVLEQDLLAKIDSLNQSEDAKVTEDDNDISEELDFTFNDFTYNEVDLENLSTTEIEDEEDLDI